MRSRVVAGALVALLLAGCSADAEPPTSLPPLTASPAVTTLAPLSTPSGINAPDAFGASAFAKYWFAVLNRALQTNEASELDRLSDAGCDSCTNLISAIQAAKQAGTTTPDLSYDLIFAEAPPLEDGRAIVEVAWQVSASKEFDRNGKQINSKPASGRLLGQLLLGRASDSWSVLGFRTVAAPK